MFDFEKRDVYIKANTYNKSVTAFLLSKKLDCMTNDQLRSASFSIMLNIAEGFGRFTTRYKAFLCNSKKFSL